MLRTYIAVIAGLTGLCFFVFPGIAMAGSEPHGGTGYENVTCNSCHMIHNALGNSLTNRDTNANLCVSCHSTNNLAENWPFSSTGDQAVPGTSGTSHRWDRDMTAGVAPLSLASGNANNPYGLRTPGELQSSTLKLYMQVFANVVTCSVCHAQHSQSNAPYDPYSFNASSGDGGGVADGGSPNSLSDGTKSWTGGQWATYTVVITGSVNASNIGIARTILSNGPTSLTATANFPAAIVAGDTYYITKTGSSSDYGTATGGSTTSVVTTKNWTTNWAGYYVKMTSGSGDNVGLRRRITGSDATTLTTDAFPTAVVNGDKFYITASRHFMRASNVLNEMCVDCHYYRSASHASGQSVRNYDGNKKSHPVGKKLTDVSDPTQFNASFLEPQSASWAAQSGTRGEQNGGADTNLTNNITVGIDGNINCLSCHNVHYSDSNASTVDTPSGYAP